MKCLLCGRHGLFLRVDRNGLCPACVEDQARRRAAAPKLRTERIKVAGTSFYQAEIKSLGEHNDDFDLSKRELCESFDGERVFELEFDPVVKLVPEPDNEHDKNAIRVEADEVLIGYVPKGKTKAVRELLESGRVRRIEVEITGGKYKKADDGDLDRGEWDFSAALILKVEEGPTV